MPVRKLTIAVSEYDDRIRDVVAPAINGGLDVTFKRYSTLSDLSSYEGGMRYPLTVVGHANSQNFRIGAGLGDRLHVDAFVNNLLSKNLNPSTFPFCLVAGCRAAEDGYGGLFVRLSEKLGIPVVASTTDISMGRSYNTVDMTPQDGGRWRVCFPSVGGSDLYSLVNTRRCKFIRDILETQEFKCL